LERLTSFMQENYEAIVTQPKDLALTYQHRKKDVENLAKILTEQDFNRVYLTGCGDSLFISLIAKFAFEKFTRLFTEAIPPLELSRYRKLDENFLIIAISASGKTLKTVEAAKKVKNKNMKLIALTNNMESPLAECADWVLQTRCSEPFGKSPSKTSTTALLLLFILTIELSREMNKIGKTEYERLVKEIEAIPNMADRCIKLNEKNVKRVATAFKNCHNFHFIGGGPNLGAAMLGATKVKELDCGHAEAIELEEFCHYQIIVVDEGTPVFIVLPRGESYERGLDVLKGLNIINVRPIIITSSGQNALIRERSFEVFEVSNSIEEVFSPILSVMPLQLFAFHLAVNKGKNLQGFKKPHSSLIRIYF
jgi:glucosamine--fructose-6-phosphate aminotransferase (isomerizing)